VERDIYISTIKEKIVNVDKIPTKEIYKRDLYINRKRNLYKCGLETHTETIKRYLCMTHERDTYV